MFIILSFFNSLVDFSEIAKEVEVLGGEIVSKPSATGGSGEQFIDIKIDPEFYRKMEDLVKIVGSGRSRLEVLQMRMASSNTSHAAGESKEAYHEDDSDDEKGKAKKKPSKSSSAASTKKELPKRKDELQSLLSEVTGRNDIIEEDVEDEYEMVEHIVVRIH